MLSIIKVIYVTIINVIYVTLYAKNTKNIFIVAGFVILYSNF